MSRQLKQAGLLPEIVAPQPPQGFRDWRARLIFLMARCLRSEIGFRSDFAAASAARMRRSVLVAFNFTTH